MNFEKHICDLLYTHECVIVPEFGAFITNFEPARIQSSTHTILPPRKFLVFNSSLKINDGLLATGISSRMQCSFDEAMHFIRHEVTAWHQRLKAGKTILLPGIGSFSTNKDGKLEFKPDQEQNFFNEAFGLNALVIPPLQKRSRKPKAQAVYYQKSVRKTSSRTIRRLAWAAAISIPLAAAGFWSIMNYDTLRQYTIQHSGFVTILKPESTPISDKTKAFESGSPSPITLTEAEPSEITSAETNQPAEADSDQLVQNEPEVFGDELAEAMPAASNELIPEPPSLQKRSYHIIIGSFENTTNAQQLSDKLKASGLDSRMIESTQGMYRVSMAAYVDKQEALQKLYKVREETNPGAWLLRI